VTVSIRRARKDDAAFLVGLVTHEDVQPFLAAVRATDRDGILAEIERSDVVERLRLHEPMDRRERDRRSGRDDDGGRLDRLDLRPRELDLGRGHELALGLDEVDLAGLEQRLDAGDELLHDLILAGHGLRQIEVAGEVDPGHRRVRAHPVEVARVEQRFRRDAADGDACPADTVALDERDLRATHARVQSGDVSAWTAAEDRDVVLVGHASKSLVGVVASRSSGCARYPCRAFSSM